MSEIAVIPDFKGKYALMYRWIVHHLIDTDVPMKTHFAALADDPRVAHATSVMCM